MSEDGLKKIETEGLRKLRALFPEINFDEEIKQNPELADYLRSAIVSNQNVDDPRTKPEAPKLNEDFSKYFVVNNLPKCDDAKAQKLKALLVKLLDKKNITISDADITMPFQGDTTEGVAFILCKDEEQAKFGAAVLNNYKLDKNHLLAACQINDFEKIMQINDNFEMPKSASLLDLKFHILDTRREQYLF